MSKLEGGESEFQSYHNVKSNDQFSTKHTKEQEDMSDSKRNNCMETSSE